MEQSTKKIPFDFRTIKSFEDACTKLGLNPTLLPTTGHLSPRFAQATIDQYKLWVITEAINEGWEPDWDNGKWDKYYPWFRMGASGVGFSYFVCVIDCSFSYVGSRLVFDTAEKAEYAGEQFTDLFKSVYIR